MPSILTLAGASADGRVGVSDRGDSCKWTKRNKRTGCQTRLCHTGAGRSGWEFVGTTCPVKNRKPRRRGKR